MTTPIPNPSRPGAGWWWLLVLCTGVALVSWLAYGAALRPMQATAQNPIGFDHHPPLAFYAHVFGASLALLIGPWQWLPGLRQRRPKLHRWLGRVYLLGGVLVGGLSGLVLAFQAFGGPLSQIGFGLLALLWLVSGWRAYRAIRQGRVDEHRRWMLRNFALACAAVTLRLYLPLAFVSGLPLAPAYAAIAWLCWVPNLLWAEWHIRRTATAPATARRDAFAG